MKVRESSAYILKKMYKQNKRVYESISGRKKSYVVPFLSYEATLKFDIEKRCLYVQSYLLINTGKEYYINTYYDNNTNSIITKIN